jgi:hypothetical protein
VNKVSTARKLGVVARVASEQARRSRTLRAATQAGATTARAFGRVAHQLWLEVTGVVFLLMGLSFAAGAAREFGKHQAGQAGLKNVVLAGSVALLFGWFGVSSFLRVRKKK